VVLLYAENVSCSDGSRGIVPWWHPIDVAAPMPGLLLAGWYLQEVAARNCCRSLREVAAAIVVVEVIQNHKCWMLVVVVVL